MMKMRKRRKKKRRSDASKTHLDTILIMYVIIAFIGICLQVVFAIYLCLWFSDRKSDKFYV